MFSGHVDDTDLRTLYANALAFIQYKDGINTYFSGLEACLCKVPVISSNRRASEELNEDLLSFNSESPESIFEKMNLLYTDSKLRDELSEKSYEKTAEASLRKTLSETLKVYQQVTDLK